MEKEKISFGCKIIIVLQIVTIVVQLLNLLGGVSMINLDSPDILTAQEAAKIWGKNEAYVRTALRQNPDKFPDGSVRRFGKVILVTTQGMEAATGIKDPRKLKNRRGSFDMS